MRPNHAKQLNPMGRRKIGVGLDFFQDQIHDQGHVCLTFAHNSFGYAGCADSSGLNWLLMSKVTVSGTNICPKIEN